MGVKMYKIDLNCDLGESFGRYTLGMDEIIIPLISSANVACGYHASDPVVMTKTVKLAKEAGIAIGAHPGFPDLMGFGRRNINVSPEEIKAYTTYQLGALYAFCRSRDMGIQHVKPHGAMYNMAGKDYKLARGICKAVYEFDSDIILLGLSGSEMIKEAKDVGLKVANEFFADRAYEDDGSLVARTKEGSMITDETEMIHRVIRGVKEGKVKTISGRDIYIHIDSICVHGDGIKAVDFVKCIREAFTKEEIHICPINKLV